jgi:hypothetical protein
LPDAEKQEVITFPPSLSRLFTTPTIMSWMNMQKYFLFTLVVCFLTVLFYREPVQAAGELDEVLSGFEEPVEQPAQETVDDLGGVLSGFDEPERGTSSETAGTEKTSLEWLDLFGSLTFGASWSFAHEAPAAGNPDYRGLSMLRTTGALGADIDIGSWRVRASGHGFHDAAWAIGDRDLYTNDFLNEYENELEFDDLYLSGSLTDSLDLKIGRQVVVWGKADNVRVTDVLNPLDNRTPGMVDIKYRRLPVTMTRLDYYLGDWNLSGLVLHEIRFDKNPVYNGEFFPGGSPSPPEREPTNFSTDTQQYGLALNGIFSGWDLSVYQAWVYDARSHIVMDDGLPVRVHNRVSMTGMTGNVAFGNWLFKGEGAWWQGLEYGAVPEEDFQRLDLMVGIEYTGFSETMLSMEIVNRHIFDFDDRLAASPDFAGEDLLQTALMLTRDFLNDTLQLKILCTIFGGHGEDGAFERFQLEYDYTDHVTLTGGVLLYQSGDQIGFSDVEDSDRIFFEFSYAF